MQVRGGVGQGPAMLFRLKETRRCMQNRCPRVAILIYNFRTNASADSVFSPSRLTCVRNASSTLCIQRSLVFDRFLRSTVQPTICANTAPPQFTHMFVEACFFFASARLVAARPPIARGAVRKRA